MKIGNTAWEVYLIPYRLRRTVKLENENKEKLIKKTKIEILVIEIVFKFFLWNNIEIFLEFFLLNYIKEFLLMTVKYCKMVKFLK